MLTRPTAVRAPVTFTLDVEDHRPDEQVPPRVPHLVEAVLDHLDRRNVIGTFFVVGAVARQWPRVVREVAAAGHEVALHSWDHTPLTAQDPIGFRKETRRGREVLEDLAGQAVVGYRAPTFSLVARTVWATDILCELGFTYSSSVLPAPNPLFGYPEAPAEPFCWPNGLVEFPTPLLSLGPVRVPFLGGTYLRVLPLPLVNLARAAGRGGPVPWIYAHPYDFDPAEPYWPVPDAGRLAPLLWVGRRRMFAKLDRLLAAGAGGPLRDRLAEGRRGGVFDGVAHRNDIRGSELVTTPVGTRSGRDEAMERR